jgi:hypothetical protein
LKDEYIYEIPADVFSVFNKRQYAAKGDLVRVVSVHGEVLILERMDGFRFPFAVAFKPPVEIPQTNQPDPDPKPSKKKTVIRSVPQQKGQQTLF